jgi:hypothetical protein
MKPGVGLLAIAMALMGCLSDFDGTVRTRAAHDFRCDEDKLAVKNIGGGSYEVKGCGYADTYDCVGGPGIVDTVTCRPESR